MSRKANQGVALGGVLGSRVAICAFLISHSGFPGTLVISLVTRPPAMVVPGSYGGPRTTSTYYTDPRFLPLAIAWPGGSLRVLGT